jgi:ATP-dependent Clp protease ATP-binding subunit ClpB
MQPTNPNQFTEKAWEAIAHTPDIAKQYQLQQIESEHLMKALLEQEGLASAVFTKAGVNLQKLRDRTEQFIQRQPKVSGSSSSVYLGRSLDTLLDRADNYRKEFQDEYISIEHLLLAYAKDDRLAKVYSMNLD